MRPGRFRCRRCRSGSTSIHVNSWLHGRFYAAAGRPVVATEPRLVSMIRRCEAYKSRLQALYHGAWIRPQEARTLKRAAAIAAVSAYTAARLGDAFGLGDVRVIPNWLPPDALDATLRPAHDGPFHLVFIGNWSRRQGRRPAGTDHAPTSATGSCSPYTGTPQTGRETCPRTCAPLGWAKSRAQVRAWLREADAMLFPSRLEGMPLAVLEAMGVGLPVVAARAASLPEVVFIDGETGLLCPRPTTWMPSTAAIRRLRDDPGLHEAMQMASAARARYEFGEDNAIARYVALYATVLGRRPPALSRSADCSGP